MSRTTRLLPWLVALLVHERCPVNGEVFSAAGRLVSAVTFCETPGYVFDEITPEAILDRMHTIVDHDRLIADLSRM